MVQHIRRIGAVIKVTFICTVMSFVILIGIFNPPSETGRQIFDIKSAAVISIGLGASFRMAISNQKKV